MSAQHSAHFFFTAELRDIFFKMLAHTNVHSSFKQAFMLFTLLINSADSFVWLPLSLIIMGK